MLALAIEGPDVRGFMNRLLREELFDPFEVRTVEISSLTKVEISGEIERENKEGAEAAPRAFATWARLKSLVVAVVKNHPEMPRSMKIVFSCDADTAVSLHPNALALFLNMAYENGTVQFTSASAQREFSLDRTLDEKWEEHINAFFSRNSLPVHVIM